MKKIGRFLLLLLLIGCFSHSAYAAVQVTAEVDSNDVALGEQIVLSITANDSDAEEPNLDFLREKFKVYSSGTSSSTQIINMKVSVSKTFNYVLIPMVAGKFKISSINVAIDGKNYETEPFILNVRHSGQARSKSKATPGVTPRAKSEAQDDKAMFVTASVSNKNPYKNEQVVFTFRFFKRRGADLRGAGIENFDFDNFWTEDAGKERQYTKTINGISYVVNELKKVLFPTKVGKLVVTPVNLIADVVVRSQNRRRNRGGMMDDSFFGGFFGNRGRIVKKRLSTKPITINVKPLVEPAKGNLVGHFSVKSNISDRNVKQGDSVTLTITINGSGNIRDIEDLKIPESPNYKLYDDKPELKVMYNGKRIIGQKVIKKALVPIKPGRIEIPPFGINFFDPKKGAWVHRETKAQVINVTKSEGDSFLKSVSGRELGIKKKQVELIGKDIFPIKTSIDGVKSYAGTFVYYAICLALILLPGVLYFVLRFVTKSRQELSSNLALQRKNRAMKSFNKNYKVATKEKTPEKIETALKEFVGNVLNVNGLATTHDEFERLLLADNNDDELVKSIKKTLELLEGAKFGAYSLSAEDLDDNLSKTKDFVSQLKRRYRL
jgi:hypothetical protein